MMYVGQNYTAQWIRTASCLLLFSLLLTACGVDSDHFRFEGRLRNMNQGEFLVYSTDGGINGIDTVRVQEGRFAYETELRTPSVLIVMFPNFSELPLFAQPGKVLTLKGDASHLKEMTVEGSTDNEDMTKLRMELNRLMPPEIPDAIEKYIRENPESAVSNYLLQRYFMMDRNANHTKGAELAALMFKSQPDNVILQEWKKQLDGLRKRTLKGKLPPFSATDLKGRTVTQDQLKSKVGVILLWATWNYQSTDMQRRLRKLKKEHGDKLSVIGICLDGNKRECRRRLDIDSVQWSTICDGRLWKSPLIEKLGLTDMPSNLIVDSKQTIIDHDLNPQQLEDKIGQLLK